jgi:hypothetical protein
MNSWLPIAAAALSPAPSAPTNLALEQRDANLLITRVTPDPGVGSGILATAVGITGTVGGTERTYLIPFMGSGQPKPSAGQHCAITWKPGDRRTQWNLGDGSRVQGGRVIREFHCGP